MLLLLTLLVLHQSDDLPENVNEEDMVYFKPLLEGSEVNFQNFHIIVPESTLYADEENAPLMIPLTGAIDIPNCVGIFYSNAGTFNYSVIVQHYGQNAFTLKPEIASENLIEAFKKHHLYRNQPFNGQADVVIPPTYQREENSFTLGMQYTEEDHTLVIVKKIYATPFGALVLSYKGNEGAFVTEPEAIDRIFNSVSLNHDFTSEINQEAAPVSYLELLGFSPPKPKIEIAQPVEAEKKGLDKKVLGFSLALAIAGIFLLLFALKFRKTQGIHQT